MLSSRKKMQGKITVEHSIPNEYKWPDPIFNPETQDSEGLWPGAATSKRFLPL